MEQVLLAWVGILTVLTTLNLSLCLAVVRRLKAQAQHGEHEQLPDLLAPGTPVGDFSASTVDGGTITATTLEEPALVAFLTPGCEPCADTVSQLRRRSGNERTILVVVDDGPDGDGERYAASLRDLGEVAAAATTSPIVMAFGGLTGFPALFRVADRSVVASHRKLDSLAGARLPAPAPA